MAYCRWSTDNANCDLYVYEMAIHDRNDPYRTAFALHVSERRLVREDDDSLDSYESAAEIADRKEPGDNTMPYWMNHADHPERASHAGGVYEFATTRELVDFAASLERIGFHGPSFGWDRFLDEYPQTWMCKCGRGPVVCVNGHPRYRDEDPLCVDCCEDARPTHGCPEQDDVEW